MKQYGVILADPPWEYRNAGGNGAAANHYPTMAIKDICGLPVANHAAKDAVLYLWANWPQLPEAMQVIEAWGFTYKTGFPWVKILDNDAVTPIMGGGFWVRACSELILIAVRGKPAVPPAADRPLGLLGPRLEHSRKPDDIYQLAERHAGPWLELFARRPRVGWDQFGNEVDASVSLSPAIEMS
ncbi:MAG: DNA methyltransferase [Caldilineaceae bacterium]|nr:DNA methyltransferase [Caldilineaceae bacterium]